MVESNSRIGKIFEIIKLLPNEQGEYVSQLFQSAPLWLFENISIKNYDKDKVFIRENTPVDRVFILLKGSVKAVEHRIFGIEYDYMRFKPIKMFGSMEILLDIELYRTTLITVTPCVFLVMRSDIFRKWIQKDLHALLMETKSMGTYLLEQNRKERAFLFLNGKDRLFMVFSKNYENSDKDNKNYVNTYTRQELSNLSGLSVKTINRAIKKMEDEDYIGRRGNKIIISKDQYERMSEYIKSLVSDY